MENKFEQSLIEAHARTALNQIIAGVGANVFCSWGVDKMVGCVRKCKDGYDCCSLMLHVNGMLHTGWVIVVYNYGDDLYEVQLINDEWKQVGEWYTGLYCDQLGSVIDSLIECPVGEEEEYKKKVSVMYGV